MSYRHGTFTFGCCPDEIIKNASNIEAPDGFPMTIRSQDEWSVIAQAWNMGIDAHLEALTERSTANASTGEVNVHPDELHVLCRRLFEIGESFEPDERDENPAWTLRSCILECLLVEEI